MLLGVETQILGCAGIYRHKKNFNAQVVGHLNISNRMHYFPRIIVSNLQPPVVQVFFCIGEIMRKIISLLSLMVVIPAYSNEVLSLDDALRATYTACVGIDDALYDLKKMAGINTAITAVGTAAGAGATVVGIVKSGKDAKAEALEAILKEIAEMSKNQSEMTETEIATFMSEFNSAYETVLKSKQEAETELQKTVQQSKKLGNWRTGLMATGAATNLAGAIIAGTNKVDGDLDAQITACKNSLSALRTSIMQARINGEDISEAQSIETACSEFEYVDLSKINKRAKGAMISSGIGAAWVGWDANFCICEQR